MATDNKGVMVYLPSDLEEVLEKYCTENKITRKNKDGEPVPSMGTGIVHYLRSHLLGEVPSNVPNGFTLDDVRSLIDQAIDPLTSDLVNIQSQIIDRDNWDDLKADVADLREQLDRSPVATTMAKKPQPTASAQHEDGRIEFKAFAQNHGLTITRGDSAGDVKAALNNAGLADRYQYNSTNRVFYEVGNDD
jgi:hypothetical protein